MRARRRARLRHRPALLCVVALALACPSVIYATEPQPTSGPAEIYQGAPAVPAAPTVTPAPPEGTAAAVPNRRASTDRDEPEEPPNVSEPVEVTARAAADGSVAMNDFSFSPASVSIQAGDSVTWANRGNEPHTATGEGFDTGTVRPGGSGTATFSRAGTFSYVCSLHPNMRGTVRVASAGGEADDESAPADDAVGDASGAAGGSAGGSSTQAPATTQPQLPASGRDLGPFALLGAAFVALGAYLRWRTAGA